MCVASIQCNYFGAVIGGRLKAAYGCRSVGRPRLSIELFQSSSSGHRLFRSSSLSVSRTPCLSRGERERHIKRDNAYNETPAVDNFDIQLRAAGPRRGGASDGAVMEEAPPATPRGPRLISPAQTATSTARPTDRRGPSTSTSATVEIYSPPENVKPAARRS